jgi:spore maturation protein CgeB
VKLVVFGLTISSSWGNGHATLWRGLTKGLARRGHRVVFYERDQPFYAQHRDLYEPEGVSLVLYPSWREVADRAARDLADADAAIVTSYCPDALTATDLLGRTDGPVRVFYDLDTPITLARLRAGETIDYVGADGLAAFDLVLSYAGGSALAELRDELGARRVAPLYGSVDPDVHHPVPPAPQYRADLSYLGTFAADRQAALERFFIAPAREAPERRFVLGGACYPTDFPWSENIFFVRRLPPAEHAAFFAASRLTLNVTRSAMRQMGWCPSGRLFEAAACGAPIITDEWDGLDAFFTLGAELLIARSTADVIDAIGLSDAELQRMARAARERVLVEHSAERRAAELEDLLGSSSPAGREPAAVGLGQWREGGG